MSAPLRGCCVLAVVVVLVTSLSASAGGPPPFVADKPAIDQALAGADRVAPQFSQQLKQLRAESQPLFIIVPGILGSILHDGDPSKPFWGEKGILAPAQQEKLEYREARAQVEFMDDFVFVGEHDVYGRLRDHLRFYSFGRRRAHLEFPYDWRQDIRQSAADFDAFVRGQRDEIAGRDVVIIAHSMGGLVVRWWYYTHFSDAARKAEYEFLRTPRVLFLGVPHYGSPAAVVALVGGYGDGGAFEKLTNYFARDLNDVGASFYSIYQMLPFGASSVMFQDKQGQVNASVDLLHRDVWEACNFGWRLRQRNNIPWREFYDAYLQKRFDAARELSETMVRLGQDPAQNPPGVCFYSDKTDTPETVLIVQTGNGCKPKAQRVSRGDGRVVAEYTPFVATPHAHGAVQRLRRPHMELPQDVTFIQYIDDMRDDALARAVIAADPTPQVHAAFRKAGVLLPVPVGFARIDDPATQQILQFDRAVLDQGRAQRRSDAELSKLVYGYARAAKDDSQTALRLYALAIAFDRGGTWAAYAGNHLGAILVNSDRWDEALPYLEHTKQHLHLLDAKEKKLLQRFHNNIGVAYARTGKHEEALRHYRAAKTREATQNANNLCNALKEQNLEVADGLCGRGGPDRVAAILIP